MAFGAIHGVTRDITEGHIMAAFRATSSVVRVYRLTEGESTALMLASMTLCEAVTIGYVRYKTHPYVEKPTQCTL